MLQQSIRTFLDWLRETLYTAGEPVITVAVRNQHLSNALLLNPPAT